MNYIINEEMLEAFKNSLRLNKQHARIIIDDAEESGYVLTKAEEIIVERQKEIIKHVDTVLEELEKIETRKEE